MSRPTNAVVRSPLVIVGTSSGSLGVGTAIPTNSAASNTIFVATGSNTGQWQTPYTLSVTDGSTTVNSPTTLNFTSGATVTNLGAGTAGVAVSGGGGGSGTVSVTQTAHGLSVGNVVRLSGTSYITAKADSAANAEAVGMVSAVADANHFTLTTNGRVTGLSGLTAASVYFLSPTSAGALTATEPSTVGQISKPQLVADSTTSGLYFNMRGEIVAASGGSGGTSTTISYPALKPATLDSTYGDDFTTRALNARWTSAHGATLSDGFGGATDGSYGELPYFNVGSPMLFQVPPAGDFDFQVGGMYITTNNLASTLMYGCFILDSSGNGAGAIVYTDHNGYLAQISAYQYSSAIQTAAGAGWSDFTGTPGNEARLWCRLVKSSGNYTAYFSWSGKSWEYSTAAGAPTAFTPAVMGFGVCFPTSNLTGRFGAEWVNKV